MTFSGNRVGSRCCSPHSPAAIPAQAPQAVSHHPHLLTHHSCVLGPFTSAWNPWGMVYVCVPRGLLCVVCVPYLFSGGDLGAVLLPRGLLHVGRSRGGRVLQSTHTDTYTDTDTHTTGQHTTPREAPMAALWLSLCLCMCRTGFLAGAKPTLCCW
jgi:hypothetical protein